MILYKIHFNNQSGSTSEFVVGAVAANDGFHRLLGTHFDACGVDGGPLHPLSVLLGSNVGRMPDGSGSFQKMPVLHVSERGKVYVIQFCRRRDKRGGRNVSTKHRIITANVSYFEPAVMFMSVIWWELVELQSKHKMKFGQSLSGNIVSIILSTWMEISYCCWFIPCALLTFHTGS